MHLCAAQSSQRSDHSKRKGVECVHCDGSSWTVNVVKIENVIEEKLVMNESEAVKSIHSKKE
jgi:hypothetical protein